MITKETTYKRAFEQKALLLKKKEQHREVMVAAAYNTNPRLTEIDREISSIGARLAITALSGKSEELARLREISKALTEERAELLKKAEVPEIVYDCELCKDTGYISGKICGCIKKRAAEIMTEELSKEMPLGECRFDNFDLKYYFDKDAQDGTNPKRRMTAIFKVFCEYAMNFSPKTSPNLLLMGGAGLGKTHLSLSIVSAVVEKGYMPVYGSAENIFSCLEAEKFSGEGRGSYDAILNCDLLVIDDLGAEMSTAFTKSVLYNLVNTRILSKRPTIISTNLTMKEIETRYTARIASRLIGTYDAYKFLGQDIRQQKRLENS